MTNKIMQSIMLSCKKAAELIDKKSLFDLNWKESIQLKMHSSMCSACTNYMKQSSFLDRAMQSHLSQHENESSLLSLNEKLKEKIISALK